jgi:hypothetical protein
MQAFHKIVLAFLSCQYDPSLAVFAKIDLAHSPYPFEQENQN